MHKLLLPLVLIAALPVTVAARSADIDGNGIVDRADVEVMRAAFHGADPRADLNGDGIVDFADLALLRAAYERGGASAAPTGGGGLPTITLLPALQSVDVGVQVELELWMDFSVEATVGGAINVFFDETALGYVSFVFDAAFPDDPAFRRLPDTNIPGVLGGLAFGEFDGLTGPHLVGRLTFDTLTPVLTSLTMDDDPLGFGPFFSAVDFMAMQVDLTGASVDIQPLGVPMIDVSPTDITFPPTLIGAQAFANVTVSNPGIVDLVIAEVAVGDPLLAPFAISADACTGQTLPPAGSCIVTAEFAPVATGTFGDSFNVASDAVAQPDVTVQVSGSGVTGPVIDVTPLDLDLGTIDVGASVQANVTVANNGDQDLVLGAVGGLDPLAPPFSIVADGCSFQAVVPSGSCTITVEYAPTAAGPANDAFDIPSNDVSTPSVTVLVSGAAESVTMTTAGIFAQFAQCRNLVTAQFVNFPLGGVNTFDCGVQGLAFTSGQSLRLAVRGVANGAPTIGGTVASLTPSTVICRNVTTAQTVSFAPAGTSWSCTGQGLTATLGDTILMLVIGTAD